MFGATDRLGKALGPAAALLLAYLWTRADAPSKRPGGGHTFLRPHWRVDIASIAADLGRDRRNVERQLASLTKAGLIRRGEKVFEGRAESGIWLADLGVGRWPPAKLPDTGEVAHDRRPAKSPVPPPATSPVELGASPGDFAGLYKEARSQDPDLIPEQDNHVVLAWSTLDDSSSESPTSESGRGRVKQAPLFDDPNAPAAKPPARDGAAEVFAYLRERIIATKADLGIKPARGPTVLSPGDRRNIEARIREQVEAAGPGSTIDVGIEACKQVVDVDESEARRKGEISPYWNASTPFRNDKSQFESRLLRWREDGDHLAFGGAKPGRGPRQRTDLGYRPDVSPEMEEILRDHKPSWLIKAEAEEAEAKAKAGVG